MTTNEELEQIAQEAITEVIKNWQKPDNVSIRFESNECIITFPVLPEGFSQAFPAFEFRPLPIVLELARRSLRKAETIRPGAMFNQEDDQLRQHMLNDVAHLFFYLSSMFELFSRTLVRLADVTAMC